MARLYNPESLQLLAREVINQRLRRPRDANRLEIPCSLKKELYDNYLEDNYHNTAWKPTEDAIETLNYYTFGLPWVNVSATIWLTIMNWDVTKPTDFCHDISLVTYLWYEDQKEPIQCIRYCRDCAKDIEHPKLYKTWDKVTKENLMDEVFQLLSHWCMKCHTTTLFKIMEYPWPGLKRYWDDICADTDSE